MTSWMSLGGQHAGNVFGIYLMADAPAVTDLLARSALFGALTSAQRQALAEEMRNVALDVGEMLFARGDPGDEILLMIAGLHPGPPACVE